MQNVNLYLPELRPKQEWVTAATAVILGVGFLGILCLASIFTARQLTQFELSLTELEQQKIHAQQRVQSLKSKSPAGDRAKLDAELAHLRELISARVRIMELISGQSLGNEAGYASRLQGLALAAKDTLALDHFKFTRGAGFIEMSGEARSPEAVALLVAELKAQPGFASAVFGPLTLTESKTRAGIYVFSLGLTPVFDAGSHLAEN